MTSDVLVSSKHIFYTNIFYKVIIKNVKIENLCRTRQNSNCICNNDYTRINRFINHNRIIKGDFYFFYNYISYNNSIFELSN